MISWPNEYSPLTGASAAFTDIFGPLNTSTNSNLGRGPAAIYDSGGLYDGSRSNYDIEPTFPADGLHLGRGYFVYLKSVKPQYTLLGTSPTGATVSVPLQGGSGLDGWNMIGVPSTTAISVSRLVFQFSNGTTAQYSGAINDGYIYSTVYGYTPSSNTYSAVSQMQPFQGYWIRAKISGMTVLIPTGGG